MAKTVLAADQNEDQLGTESANVLLGGQTLRCLKTSYRVRVGKHQATMSHALVRRAPRGGGALHGAQNLHRVARSARLGARLRVLLLLSLLRARGFGRYAAQPSASSARSSLAPILPRRTSTAGQPCNVTQHAEIYFVGRSAGSARELLDHASEKS